MEEHSASRPVSFQTRWLIFGLVPRSPSGCNPRAFFNVGKPIAEGYNAIELANGIYWAFIGPR